MSSKIIEGHRIRGVAFVAILFASGCRLALAGEATPEHASVVAARRAIAEARTLIHFDLIEQGDLKSLDGADAAVNAALAALKSESADDSQANALRDKALALRTDIAKLRATTSGTFFGYFPLARLLVGTDSTDGQVVKIATVPDAARRMALLRAFSQSLDFLPGANMHAVVLVAREGMDDRSIQIVDDLVERVAPSALATMPNLTLISDIKSSELTAPAWDAPDAAFTECCRQIVHRKGHDGKAVNLCIVLVPRSESRANRLRLVSGAMASLLLVVYRSGSQSRKSVDAGIDTRIRRLRVRNRPQSARNADR